MLTATTVAKAFTLEELQKEDGGWFTIKPAVTIAAVCRDRYSYHRCVECRMSALPNAEGKHGCAQHPVAKTKEIYRLRILLRQDDLNMWVTAFADVAELIMDLSVEEFNAFDDAGRKRIAWGVQGTKCNMTIGKNCRWYVYKLHGREYGVRWIFAMNDNANTPCRLTRGLDRSCSIWTSETAMFEDYGRRESIPSATVHRLYFTRWRHTV